MYTFFIEFFKIITFIFYVEFFKIITFIFYEMSKIPIVQYNNHSFINLEYDPGLKILFYKNREIPWKVNKSLSFNKKLNEMKTYIYHTVVIPDADGRKHKIFREKFENTYANQDPIQEQPPAQEPPLPPLQEKEPPPTEISADPCHDIHHQLMDLQVQRMMNEDEEIEKYFQTHNLDDGHIFEIGGRKWFII
jgi:hypothetical protein